MEALAARLRAAGSALGDAAEIEAAWLGGAADLVERGEPERRAVRGDAVWLEELGPEARSRKAALLSAWLDAAEALRAAINLHESERGPLVDALFPGWRGPSLRRHADQALAAEAALQRRLASGYVVRRLAELATHAALGTALETLAGAGAAWAAERNRPSLAGVEADRVRERLLAVADETAHLLERVRWVVRAALVRRPDLLETVFPRRARAAERSGAADLAEKSGTPGLLGPSVSLEAAAGAGEPPSGHRPSAADPTATTGADARPPRTPRRRRPAGSDARVPDLADEPVARDSQAVAPRPPTGGGARRTSRPVRRS